MRRVVIAVTAGAMFAAIFAVPAQAGSIVRMDPTGDAVATYDINGVVLARSGNSVLFGAGMRRYMTPYTIGNYFADDGGAVFAQLDVRGDRRFDVAVWIYAERGRMVCDASTPGGRFIRYGTFSRGDGNIVGCQVGVGYFSKSNVRWRVAAGRDGWGWDSAPNYGSFYSYI